MLSTWYSYEYSPYGSLLTEPSSVLVKRHFSWVSSDSADCLPLSLTESSESSEVLIESTNVRVAVFLGINKYTDKILSIIFLYLPLVCMFAASGISSSMDLKNCVKFSISHPTGGPK